MACLNAESLFTNISTDETIKTAVDDLFSHNMYQRKLSTSELYHLLKLATSESSFVFNKIWYKLIDGVSMALPLGPTLANHSYVITKNFGLIIVHQNLNLFHTEHMFTKYLFCLNQKIICCCSLDMWTLDIKI